MDPNIKPLPSPMRCVNVFAGWCCETLHIVIARADEDGRDNIDRIMKSAINAADLAAVMSEDHTQPVLVGWIVGAKGGSCRNVKTEADCDQDTREQGTQSPTMEGVRAGRWPTVQWIILRTGAKNGSGVPVLRRLPGRASGDFG